MSKLLPWMLAPLLLVACAETDPYKRLDPAPTPELTEEQAAQAFDERWPERFKTVQTVTLDFRVKTMTLVGYLIVQDDSFRLQGMTEQGLKLFDIACRDGVTRTVFAGEEFDDSIIGNISRDIRRVYLAKTQGETGAVRTSLGVGGLVFARGDVRPDDDGTRVTIVGRHGEAEFHFVGSKPYVDWFEHNADGRNLYRVDHYEWAEFEEHFLPSTIVLRERGVISDGPSYKLTIKVTEFETRETPWPEAVFNPPRDGEGE